MLQTQAALSSLDHHPPHPALCHPQSASSSNEEGVLNPCSSSLISAISSHYYSGGIANSGLASDNETGDMGSDADSATAAEVTDTIESTTPSSVWCGDEDDEEAERMRSAARLISSIPIYEPIDLARVSTSRPPNGSYSRATRPILPDMHMLAPMASLAGAYSTGPQTDSSDSLASLNNREVRFAVENQMLVEQHRYLVRDLGHARSAITALKQVVQAKEDKVEQYEMANMELQQRLAFIESILTPEQKQKLATCFSFSFDAQAAQQPEYIQLVQEAQKAQAQAINSVPNMPDSANARGMAPGVADSDVDGTNTNVSAPSSNALAHSANASSELHSDAMNDSDTQAAPSKSDSSPGDQAKRPPRPLSGLPAGFTFNDRPVQHLPRVNSVDYSSADGEPMDNSMESLANAIRAPPADSRSVEEIIADKLAMEQRQQPLLLQPADATTPVSSEHETKMPEDAESLASSARDSSKRSASAKGKQKPGKQSEPKRRSRFFAALRLSSFYSTSTESTGAAKGEPNNAAKDSANASNNRRRSLSLDSSTPNNAAAATATPISIPTASALDPRQKRQSLSCFVPSDSDALAASCPTLHYPAKHPGKRVDSGNFMNAKRQSSADSIGSSCSSGRYPSSLGLGLGGEGSSASSRSVSAASYQDPNTHGDDKGRKREKKTAHRLSLNPQPRRSTSAPSRPQSVHLGKRRSWISQLFSSGSSSSSNDPKQSSDASSSTLAPAEDLDTQASDEGRTRRRRVVTQSTDEISKFLGKLTLEEKELPHGARSVLEGVADVSGEDEEDAARAALSVARNRQQTLDALNGTHRKNSNASKTSKSRANATATTTTDESRNAKASPQPQWLADKVAKEHTESTSTRSSPNKRSQSKSDRKCSSSVPDQVFLDHSIIRWKQRESSAPTIKYLNPPPTSSSATTSMSGIGALGLGVSISGKTAGTALPIRHSSCPSKSPTHLTISTDVSRTSLLDDALDGLSGGRRPHSCSLPADNAPSNLQQQQQQQQQQKPTTPTQPQSTKAGGKKPTDSDSAAADSASHTSVSKWAPGFWAPLPLPQHSVSSNISWSPRSSMDSCEDGSLCGSGRPSEDARFKSPNGSAVLGTSACGHRDSNSPWELVKFTETRAFPLSPSHSRPGTPPLGRAPGFFENTIVPDSDELTVAARRSLSLRMSKNSFKQAEPLPETEDMPANQHQRSSSTVSAANSKASDPRDLEKKASREPVKAKSKTSMSSTDDKQRFVCSPSHQRKQSTDSANSSIKSRLLPSSSSLSSNRHSFFKPLSSKSSAGGSALIILASMAICSFASKTLMVAESYSGSVTQKEIGSFKAYMETFKPSMTVAGNEWAQGRSGEKTKALGLVYEITKDIDVLNRMLTFCDAVLSLRNDLAPSGGCTAWTGSRDPVWITCGNSTNSGTGGEQGDPVGHLAYCARLALTKPSNWNNTVPDNDPFNYGKTYLERAKTYIKQADFAVEQHILKSQLNLADQNKQYFAKDNPYKGQGDVPWNQQMMFNYAFSNLAMAHQLLGNEQKMQIYDGLVQTSVDWFFSVVVKYTDKANNTAYNWGYNPAKRIGEDSNHGSLDTAGFSRLYAARRYGITKEQMTPFANVAVDVMPLGTGNYSGRVDGTTGVGNSAGTTAVRSGFLLMMEFRPDAFEKIASADITIGQPTSSVDQFSRFLWVKHRLANKCGDQNE
ncbi:hypothetical protein GGI12_001217 [Dipsacomyces acuminosporus]|nr:hypothetical protein GGI12_001217 [Dipsacomyces acuminosporus]